MERGLSRIQELHDDIRGAARELRREEREMQELLRKSSKAKLQEAISSAFAELATEVECGRHELLSTPSRSERVAMALDRDVL